MHEKPSTRELGRASPKDDINFLFFYSRTYSNSHPPSNSDPHTWNQLGHFQPGSIGLY